MYPCFRFRPSSNNDALRQTDHRFSTATFLSLINTAKAKASQQVPSVALDMVGRWSLHNHRCTLLLYTNRLAVPPVAPVKAFLWREASEFWSHPSTVPWSWALAARSTRVTVNPTRHAPLLIP